jgi:L-amino acid N-acyltransferase YncA
MAADGDNDLLIRQAKIADFKAVLDIYDDVYEGLDYMPTIYHEFFHSRQHIFYVAENSSGQLVGICMYVFIVGVKYLLHFLAKVGK